jgi:ribosome-binding protein aMBF1 (putative translation factor)
MNNTVENPIEQLKKEVDSLRDNFPKGRIDKTKLALCIGQLVKEIREQRGWTIHKLAKTIDRNMAFIVDLERGKKLPNLSILEMIVNALEQGERWKW